jgi:uncharacterized protein (DUF2235 family)
MSSMSFNPIAQQLVVCMDGTNNTLTGGQAETNVAKLHNLISDPAQSISPDFERVLYYDPGVGSSGALPPTSFMDWVGRTWQRVQGLASGRGAYDNIAEAYLFVMANWRQPRDQIYVFGFSRGAFTARAVAGMIDLFGVVRPEYAALVPMLVHVYFSPDERDATARRGVASTLQGLWLRLNQTRADAGHGAAVLHTRMRGREAIAKEVRDHFAGAGRGEAWVHWVGVWDTVESVGLPATLSQFNPNPGTLDRFNAITGQREPKHYRHVRHALALDEHRWAFSPRLYQQAGDLSEALPERFHAAMGVFAEAPQQPALLRTFKQRWFPGDHCDVGGGHANSESGISQASLKWMVEEVAPEMGIQAAIDLSYAPDTDQPTQTPVDWWRHSTLWDTPIWALTPLTVRDMHPMSCPELTAISGVHPDQVIHTVWERQRPWWPLVLTALLGLLCLLMAGQSLLLPQERWGHLISTDPGALRNDWLALVHGVQAFQDLADHQLAALRGQGLMTDGFRPWQLDTQVNWALAWDLGLIFCWGYWMARVASRAFAWLAGDRRIDSQRPWWRLLGWAPFCAVAADIASNLCVWLAMAANGLGTDGVALVALWLCGLFSLLKAAGLTTCLALVATRWRIGFNPGRLWPGTTNTRSQGADTEALQPPPARHRHDTADTFAAGALALALIALWAWGRLAICWGQYNWIGTGVCNGHLGAILLVLMGLLPIVRIWRDKPDTSQTELVSSQAVLRSKRVHLSIALAMAILLAVAMTWLLLGTPWRF